MLENSLLFFCANKENGKAILSSRSLVCFRILKSENIRWYSNVFDLAQSKKLPSRAAARRSSRNFRWIFHLNSSSSSNKSVDSVATSSSPSSARFKYYPPLILLFLKHERRWNSICIRLRRFTFSLLHSKPFPCRNQSRPRSVSISSFAFTAS